MLYSLSYQYAARWAVCTWLDCFNWSDTFATRARTHTNTHTHTHTHTHTLMVIAVSAVQRLLQMYCCCDVLSSECGTLHHSVQLCVSHPAPTHSYAYSVNTDARAHTYTHTHTYTRTCTYKQTVWSREKFKGDPLLWAEFINMYKTQIVMLALTRTRKHTQTHTHTHNWTFQWV